MSCQVGCDFYTFIRIYISLKGKHFFADLIRLRGGSSMTAGQFTKLTKRGIECGHVRVLQFCVFSSSLAQLYVCHSFASSHPALRNCTCVTVLRLLIQPCAIVCVLQFCVFSSSLAQLYVCYSFASSHPALRNNISVHRFPWFQVYIAYILK